MYEARGKSVTGANTLEVDRAVQVIWRQASTGIVAAEALLSAERP
jgi:hypothetical protein